VVLVVKVDKQVLVLAAVALTLMVVVALVADQVDRQVQVLVFLAVETTLLAVLVQQTEAEVVVETLMLTTLAQVAVAVAVDLPILS
jgi:hypothetical protein